MAASKQSTAVVSQTAKKIEKGKIADLKPYHRQDVTYHPLTGPEFARFKDDIKRNGINQPIEITVDGEIIDGHQRCRAVAEIGWDEVQVWVRDDTSSAIRSSGGTSTPISTADSSICSTRSGSQSGRTSSTGSDRREALISRTWRA
jgi:hypothetical protein